MKWLLWFVLTVGIALSSIALAAAASAPGRNKGPGKGRPRVTKPIRDAGASQAPSSPSAATDASGPKAAQAGAPERESTPDGSAAVDVKVLDSGTQVLRFGEMEIEGRLRSPQIVYFLRRVRAEFAAEDLGHRTFLRELSETRKEPNF